MEELGNLTDRWRRSGIDHTWLKVADVVDAVKTRHINRIRQDWHQDAPFTADSTPENSKSRHVHKREHEHLNYLSCRAFDSDVECDYEKEHHICSRRKNSVVVELAAYRDDNRMEHGLRGEEAYSFGVYFGKDSKWNLSHHVEGYSTLHAVLKEASIAGMNQVLISILAEEGDPFNAEIMRGVTFRVPSESFARKAKEKIHSARLNRSDENKPWSHARRDGWFELTKVANKLKDNGVEIVFWPLVYPTKRNHAHQLAVEACGGEVLWRKNPFKGSRRKNGTCMDRDIRQATADEIEEKKDSDTTEGADDSQHESEYIASVVA